ncbi:biosynthetic peptidoglycan transglycosylase [Oryzihumus sp.]|uniref:biosynthetic peptidoglycan transglycosylase n=1 Tax=Oryzihumus sp. TaxID=1968903 RepID=UPI002ED9116C
MAPPTVPVRAARRRGRLRRLGLVAGSVVLALLLALAALWQVTPGVQDAMARVRAIERAHGAPALPSLPRDDKVARALVATEDSRFWTSPGVDPQSVVRAGLATVTGSSDVGGATLEQQLAKNLWFGGRRDRAAQLQAAVLALKLDRSWTKDEVLRMYLAQVYFGHGFYGLAQAAHGYFGQTPAQLSWAQASMLAGLVQAPSAYDPLVHLQAGKQRQRHVLDRLVSTGVLTPAQADAAFAAPLHLV